MKTNNLEKWNKKLLALVASLALMLTISAGTQTVSAGQLPDQEGAVVELHMQDGGTRWYDSVQDALNVVRSRETVTLLQDVVLSEPLTVDDIGSAVFDFDLNGHYIKAEQEVPYALIVSSNSVNVPTITLKDSQHSENGRIWAEGRVTSNTAVKVEKGTLILQDGGMIEANNKGVEVAGGNFTLKDGGTIDALNGPAIDVNSSNSTVSIEGGNIETYETEDQSGNPEFRDAIEVDAANSISVTGGNLHGTVAGDGATGFITGGTFRPCPNDEYIADGYIALYISGFGQYKVVKNENKVVFDPEVATYNPFDHRQRHTTAKLISPAGTELTESITYKWYKFNEKNNNWVDIDQDVANPYLDDAVKYKAVLTYDGKESEGEFTVQPYDISDCRNQTTSKTFTGFDFDVTKDIEVSKPGSGVLKDFTSEVKTVSGNRDAGWCDFTIGGTGNYTGELDGSFQINPANFANVQFSLSDTEVTWKDAPWEPEVTGTLTTGTGDSAKVYTLDPSEYEVVYSNNEDPGTATVTITRKSDNYTGNTPKTLNFEIVTAVAKVTSGSDVSYFPTVATAFAAAEDGDTVELIADSNEAGPLTVDKSVTFNLGDFDLGSNDNQFDITVASGKNVQLTGSGKIHGKVVNNGTLAIKGGEILYGEGVETSYGFENYGNTVISGGIIRGGIENRTGETQITGGTIYGDLLVVSPSKLIISGGYFDKKVNQNYCAENYMPMDAPEGSPLPYTVGRFYKVSFDVNGHLNVDGNEWIGPDQQKVITGNKAEDPGVKQPTRVHDEDGYMIVKKWYKEAECTNEWNFDTEVVTEDVTLYAKWEKDHDCDWSDWEQTTAPTCIAQGEETRQCSICKEVQKRAIDIDEDAHNFSGGVTYTWADDYSSVKAEATCSLCNEKIRENALTKSEVTKEATCTEKGETTYTATFITRGFETQTKTVTDVEALGHDWNEAEYTWSDDNSSVTATRTCKRDSSHAETETAVVSTETTDPTCTEKGTTTYTSAPFDNEAFEVQTKVIDDAEALGHKWDAGKVTKPATETAEGVKTYTCTVCGETKTEPIPKIKPAPTPTPSTDTKGEDGTACGKGASAAVAEKAITSMKTDTDPAGSKFAPLKLKSVKQTKNSVTIKWTKVSGATKYVIYGNKCGKTTKPKKLATVTGKTKTIKKVAGKKLKKGTYYKFIVVALDKNNKVVSTSKLIHAATKGGKVGNHKSVTVKKAVVNKAKKLKKGRTLKLNAKAVAKSKKLKVKKHVAVRYESTNTKIATVTKKGVVKGKKKGTCYVYAIAQNGVSKKVKVVVK